MISIQKDIGCVAAISTLAVMGAAAIYLFVKYRKKGPNVVNKVRKGPVTLADPNKKYALKLIAKHNVSHDTRRFVFALPEKHYILGLPVGQHLYTSAKINGQLVVRPYTPISSDDDQGYVEFMIKVYFSDMNPRFPDGGKMTQHLESMEIGETLDFRGPEGLIVYRGNGYFDVRANKKEAPVLRHFQQLGLIAGGSGITPMLQIIRDILKNPTDPTKAALLFANQTDDDILLREDLEQLQRDHGERFRLWYTVDRPPLGQWDYSSGFVTADMIAEHLPVKEPEAFTNYSEAEIGCKSDFSAILMCGPPAMVKFACTPALAKLGFPADNSFVF